jgi:drug/metabolite transporter (DMT)-like permease
MVFVTLLWSMAGIVTRRLDSATGFEASFWRSAFNALALVVLLARLRGASVLRRTLLGAGPTLWLSGACWAVMFTAFMVAITMTTVANVLVTMALAPLLTALVARVALGQRLPARTWTAIVAAGAGIGWMYAHQLAALDDPRHLAGIATALAVPIAAALNWTAIQRSRRGGADLLAAVLIGAVLSSLATLPFALPFHAGPHDIALLALLGVAQLAVPCLVSVAAARVLAAPEVALLALLEIVFGVAWTWLGAGEAPGRHVLEGGVVVLGALVANESIALRQRRSVAGAA